jgi:enoyl-CoA hydratase
MNTGIGVFQQPVIGNREGLMAYEAIVIEQEGPVGILKLNRPQALNALNRQVITELISVLEEIEKGVMPKVLIVTGAGEKAFVAGTDIIEMEKLSSFEAREFASFARRAIDQVAGLNRPVIAAINGFALGGGCELAMACDIRIASEKAKMGQPETGLGIIPGSGGTQRLPRLVGPSKAKQLVFTGEIIDARTALQIGLVDRVVPPEQLMEEAKKMALTIAAKPRVALALAKSAINKGLDMDLQNGLSYEIECFAECFSTQDQKEGMRAFSEKRKPDYKDQ